MEVFVDIVTWGVRGSYPVTDPEMKRYGGNTLCFEIRERYTPPLILDAGTGIVPLGRTLPREGEAHLFISHMHLDHVQGLPFFAPIHNPDWELHLYVPKGRSEAVDAIFNGCLFPLRREELLSHTLVREMEPGEPIQVGGVSVTTYPVPHPGGCLAFRLESATGSACVIPDIEVHSDADRALACDLLRHTDLAFVDAHFTEAEYLCFTGWGHTAAERWAEMALQAEVRRLVLCHHAPYRTDVQIDAMVESLRQRSDRTLPLSTLSTSFDAAVEGRSYSTCQHDAQ